MYGGNVMSEHNHLFLCENAVGCYREGQTVVLDQGVKIDDKFIDQVMSVRRDQFFEKFWDE